MRRYDPENTAELMEIICNRCGKKVHVSNGIPQEDMLHVEKNWGYFSRKDGSRYTFDICEDCYDEWMAGFVVPAAQEEVVELL